MWTYVFLLFAVSAVGGLVWWVTRPRPQAAKPELKVRYQAQPLLGPERIPTLTYLNEAFPGQAVLMDVPLARMLTVRQLADNRRALAALAEHVVDYVVCDKDGLPQFAFELERFHLSRADEHEATLKRKNRMLASAGIRLVFLRPSVDRMPPPDALRRQLDLADLRPPATGVSATDSPQSEAVRSLKSELDARDSLFSSARFRESELMGLSGLMSLDDDTLPPCPTAPAPGSATAPLRAPPRRISRPWAPFVGAASWQC